VRRRGFLSTAGSLASVPFLGVADSQASARAAGSGDAVAPAPGLPDMVQAMSGVEAAPKN
jgi:hypothetical protein